MLIAEVALDTGWPSILLAYGPLGVFALVVLYFVIWYGPRLIEGHLAFMNLCRETHGQQHDFNRSVTDSLSTLTETSTAQRKDCQKTHKMLGHLAEAGKAAVQPGPLAPDINAALTRVLDERDR